MIPVAKTHGPDVSTLGQTTESSQNRQLEGFCDGIRYQPSACQSHQVSYDAVRLWITRIIQHVHGVQAWYQPLTPLAAVFFFIFGNVDWLTDLPRSDWNSLRGCIGLCTRHRGILQSNNECGTPCMGPKSLANKAHSFCQSRENFYIIWIQYTYMYMHIHIQWHTCKHEASRRTLDRLDTGHWIL